MLKFLRKSAARFPIFAPRGRFVEPGSRPSFASHCDSLACQAITSVKAGARDRTRTYDLLCREHAIRLAGFLALIKGQHTITEALAKDATDLVLWHWRQIEEEYDETRDDAVKAVAADAKEYISYNAGVMSSRQLQRKMHIHKEAVLELLEEGHLGGCSMWKDGQCVNIGWTELMPNRAELISPLPKREEAS